MEAKQIIQISAVLLLLHSCNILDRTRYTFYYSREQYRVEGILGYYAGPNNKLYPFTDFTHRTIEGYTQLSPDYHDHIKIGSGRRAISKDSSNGRIIVWPAILEK